MFLIKTQYLPPNGYGQVGLGIFIPRFIFKIILVLYQKVEIYFLTNIQRFVTRNDEVNNKDSSIDYFLGEKPVV